MFFKRGPKNLMANKIIEAEIREHIEEIADLRVQLYREFRELKARVGICTFRTDDYNITRGVDDENTEAGSREGN